MIIGEVTPCRIERLEAFNVLCILCKVWTKEQRVVGPIGLQLMEPIRYPAIKTGCKALNKTRLNTLTLIDLLESFIWKNANFQKFGLHLSKVVQLFALLFATFYSSSESP